MAIGKKLIKDAVKEVAEKARAAQRKRRRADQNKPSPNYQSGQPEPGTVGARKTTKAKPTGVTKAKPTGVRKKAAPTGVTKAKPTKGKVNPRAAKSAVSKTFKKNPPALSTIAAGSTIAGLVGGSAGVALAINKRNKPATKAAKVTFGEAFKKARKEGEGTKFTWNGKSYTAVTKDDLKKKGYDANELKQYANRKGKARGPVRRAAQGIKKVLLGKDKKFGGDKGAIDFIRRPKKKAAPKKKMDGGMANSSEPKKYQSGGMAPVAGPRRPSKSTLNADLASGRALSGRVGPPRVGPPARPTAPKKVNPRGTPSFGPPGLNKGGMATKKYKAGGLATKGLGKAYINSKR